MEAFRKPRPALKAEPCRGPADYEQIPALAQRGRARVTRFFEVLNIWLGESPFVAGACYSMADITGQVTIEFAKRAKLTPPVSCTHLNRRFEGVSARSSAKA